MSSLPPHSLLSRYLPAAEKAVEAELLDRLARSNLSFEHRRRLVADYFRRVEQLMHLLAARPLWPAPPPPQPVSGARFDDEPAAPAPSIAQPATDHLPARQRDVLMRLLGGDSEKQAASALRLSPHTVHAYVQRIYRSFGASSRGELLAKFVRAR